MLLERQLKLVGPVQSPLILNSLSIIGLVKITIPLAISIWKVLFTVLLAKLLLDGHHFCETRKETLPPLFFFVVLIEFLQVPQKQPS